MIGESESSAACRVRSQQTHGCFSNASDGAMDQTAGEGEVGRFAGPRRRISGGLLASYLRPLPNFGLTSAPPKLLAFFLSIISEIDAFHKNPTNPLANFAAPSSLGQGRQLLVGIMHFAGDKRKLKSTLKGERGAHYPYMRSNYDGAIRYVILQCSPILNQFFG